MSDTLTINIGLNKLQLGASVGLWNETINKNTDIIDSAIQSIKCNYYGLDEDTAKNTLPNGTLLFYPNIVKQKEQIGFIFNNSITDILIESDLPTAFNDVYNELTNKTDVLGLHHHQGSDLRYYIVKSKPFWSSDQALSYKEFNDFFILNYQYLSNFLKSQYDTALIDNNYTPSAGVINKVEDLELKSTWDSSTTNDTIKSLGDEIVIRAVDDYIISTKSALLSTDITNAFGTIDSTKINRTGSIYLKMQEFAKGTTGYLDQEKIWLDILTNKADTNGNVNNIFKVADPYSNNDLINKSFADHNYCGINGTAEKTNKITETSWADIKKYIANQKIYVLTRDNIELSAMPKFSSDGKFTLPPHGTWANAIMNDPKIYQDANGVIISEQREFKGNIPAADHETNFWAIPQVVYDFTDWITAWKAKPENTDLTFKLYPILKINSINGMKFSPNAKSYRFIKAEAKVDITGMKVMVDLIGLNYQETPWISGVLFTDNIIALATINSNLVVLGGSNKAIIDISKDADITNIKDNPWDNGKLAITD